MLTGAQLGSNVTIATPRGYSPDIEIVTKAREIAAANGCEVRLLQDPQAAVEGADAVYTDVCVSMGFEHESTKRAPIFRPFQVNEALMGKAASHAVFMHCLPARRNAEVTDAVLDGRSPSSSTRPKTACTAKKHCFCCCSAGWQIRRVFSSKLVFHSFTYSLFTVHCSLKVPSMSVILESLPSARRLALPSPAGSTPPPPCTGCGSRRHPLCLYGQPRPADETDYDEIPRKALEYGAEKGPPH